MKAFNVACIEQNGFEADDLIATYAREIVDAGGDVTIVSSDKDLMQLVRPGVVMLDAMKGKKIGRDEVIEKFGVPPEKVVDVQSLAGDSTDNVPGVPGIGVKTAAELIKEYGDLDALLARAGEIKQPKRREKLIEFADQARVSRELVRLKDDVPDMIPADALGVRDPDPPELLGFLRVMEFNTLTRRISEGLGAEPPAPVEVPRRRYRADQGSRRAGRRKGEERAGRFRVAGCRRRRGCRGGQGAVRPLEVRNGRHARAARSLDHEGVRGRPRRLRHRDDVDRSDGRRAGRLLHGGGAGRSLLRAARPSGQLGKLRLRRARRHRAGARWPRRWRC